MIPSRSLIEPSNPSESAVTDGFPHGKVAVLVADSQSLFRSGLVRIFRDDGRFDVVADSADGADVAEICALKHVDVMVTDLQLGATDAIELTRQVALASPSTRVLILTSVADSRVVPALSAGAAGFLLKNAEPEAIVSALVSIYLGDRVLCSEAANWLVGAASNESTGGVRRLTRRETEVVRLLAAGAPNKDIARRLDISDKTVRNYVSRVYRKLALRNRAQIATYALHSGIAYQRQLPGEEDTQ
jgi:DNA-binding NarL/FixJ family response regulator